jgi:serpin B
MTTSPGGYPVAVGMAPRLAPAGDGGAAAGAEINDFGVDLLRRLDSSGNLCVSPASIAFSLAMVRPGARGATATEMDTVFHDFGTPGQAAEIAALAAALQSRTLYDDSGSSSTNPEATPNHSGEKPVGQLLVSNAVFSQWGMTLQQAYLDALSSWFGAGVGLVDYKTDLETARQIINRWASKWTGGRVPQILQPDEITNQTRIVLANAIYLKSTWHSQFDPDKTRSLPFYRPVGQVSVPTMAIDGRFGYSAGAGYRAVELPLGSGLSMTIVAPDDMKSYVRGLTGASLGDIFGNSKTYDVDLALPRFSAETRIDLADVLSAMGMPTAFTSHADLSGITLDEPLAIDKVIHQANIDVDEYGTMASAVTVTTGKPTAGGPGTPPPHVQFHVDRPFLYFIRDRSSGAVLYMGRVDDPSVKRPPAPQPS